jgi:hypothetical protein
VCDTKVICPQPPRYGRIPGVLIASHAKWNSLSPSATANLAVEHCRAAFHLERVLRRRAHAERTSFSVVARRDRHGPRLRIQRDALTERMTIGASFPTCREAAEPVLASQEQERLLSHVGPSVGWHGIDDTDSELEHSRNMHCPGMLSQAWAIHNRHS